MRIIIALLVLVFAGLIFVGQEKERRAARFECAADRLMNLERPADLRIDRSVVSPNSSLRRHFFINTLIFHYTGMETADASLQRLTDPAAQVSAHYLIDRDGSIRQLVDECDIAFHALGNWRGKPYVNVRSIGIELQNTGRPDCSLKHSYEDFTPQQLEAALKLSRDILKRNPRISPRNVLAHSDVAPQKQKCDPGEKFPWQRFAASGVGLWVDAAHDLQGPAYRRGDGDSGKQGPIHKIQQLLQSYGYDITPDGNFDERMENVIIAFQRHYRPQRVDGIADALTLAVLKQLVDAASREEKPAF